MNSFRLNVADGVGKGCSSFCRNGYACVLVCPDSFFGRVAEAERAGDGGTSVGNGSLTFRFSVSLKFLKKFFIFLYHRYNPCRRENIL